MPVVRVLVPRRVDGGQRDRVWAWIRRQWARDHPAWPIVEAPDSGHGPFNRSAAVNAAAGEAGGWDVAVVADADSIADPSQVVAAVETAHATGAMTVAFERFAALSRGATDAIVIGGDVFDWDPAVEWELYGTCSSMIAVPRRLWDTIGGFDERFEGWGMEDVAFQIAAFTFGGPIRRIPGTCWHLWHEPAPRTSEGIEANRALLDRYAAAANSPQAMSELLAEARQDTAP